MHHKDITWSLDSFAETSVRMAMYPKGNIFVATKVPGSPDNPHALQHVHKGSRSNVYALALKANGIFQKWVCVFESRATGEVSCYALVSFRPEVDRTHIQHHEYAECLRHIIQE
jgi:hypothetical protein